MAPEHLPVFVYGTLRLGGRFHADLLAGRFDDVRPARLSGAVMWDNRGAYPFVAVVDEDVEVEGELFSFASDEFAGALVDLDRLEGHVPGRTDNLYERTVVLVETERGTERAWAYVRDPTTVDELDAELPRIATGDWFERRQPPESRT